MVTIQRSHLRQGKSVYGTQLPFGNDYSSTLSSLPVASPKWTSRLLFVVVLLSWVTAFRMDEKLKNNFSLFKKKANTMSTQKARTFDMIQGAKKKRDAILKKNRQQQRTKRLFDHEARMSEELYEMKETSSNSEVTKLIEQRRNGITSSWVKQRQDALYHKIVNLQSIVQDQSRTRAIAKYGPGPHHVQFDVLTGQNTRTPGSFVVELALDLVPYSHHVIAAAPVNFGTFDPKLHHFEALGFDRLAFPDYSSSYPHSQYTLGFSGHGPNFYINAIDNSGHHGPGGQAHHEISADADPCFGKIISGHHVLQQMMPDRSPSSNANTWEDYDLTRIVRVRVMDMSAIHLQKGRT